MWFVGRDGVFLGATMWKPLTAVDLLYRAGDRKKYMAPVNATHGLFPDLGVCVFKN